MVFALIIFLVIQTAAFVWMWMQLKNMLEYARQDMTDQTAMMLRYRIEFLEKFASSNKELAYIKNSLTSIKVCAENDKTGKPNNWDSVRAAFSTPNKLDLND